LPGAKELATGKSPAPADKQAGATGRMEVAASRRLPRPQ